jgi:lipoprotein-anchoring transpeptidase ErfK/SrfK
MKDICSGKLFIFFLLYLVCHFTSFSVISTEYKLPASGSRLLGHDVTHEVVKGDYFQVLAEQYNVGFLGLMAANPGIDPFLPPVQQPLIIPKQMLLPFAKREGIVINLPELRLYYFPPQQNVVHVFPVGIGRLGLETPKTVTHIGEKRENPVWRPSADMKARYFEEHGRALADVVPAGPNNPFGKYALRLDTSEYLIHGSNQRFGIGMRASSGCIRLYDDDIQWLFNNVALGTKVRIVDQPIKLSYEPKRVKLIEVHSPLSTLDKKEDIQQEQSYISKAVLGFVGKNSANEQLFKQQINKPNGLVVSLSVN